MFVSSVSFIGGSTVDSYPAAGALTGSVGGRRESDGVKVCEVGR